MISFGEEVKKKVKSCTVTVQATIAIAQYENIKPEIRLELSDTNHVEEALDTCRVILREEYKKYKGAHNE